MNVNVWEVAEPIKAMICSGRDVDLARLAGPDTRIEELAEDDRQRWGGRDSRAQRREGGRLPGPGRQVAHGPRAVHPSRLPGGVECRRAHLGLPLPRLPLHL